MFSSDIPQAGQQPGLQRAMGGMPAAAAAAAAAAAQNQQRQAGFKYAAAARNTQNMPQPGASGVPQVSLNLMDVSLY